MPLLPKDKRRGRLHPIPRPNLPSEDQTKRAALETVMHAVFAIRQFRDGQYEALRLALTGQDCAVLLPTGAGKSMIFQLTGLIITGRVVIVAPLVSLIADQIRGLKQNGIDRAHRISHASTKTTQDFKEAADAYFLYVTPERFQRSGFRDALASASQSFPVCLAAVDEAHCVSEWGHDFRHAYLNLGRTIRTRCDPSGRNPPPIAALTGTASRAVLTDVLFQLGIDGSDPDSVISPSSFDRPEINYEVRLAKPDISNAILEDVLHCLMGDFSDHLNSGNDPLPGIVFIPSVDGYHGSAETLKTVSNVFPKAVRFSSKTPKDYQDYRAWQAQKDRNVDKFMTDEAEVIVSTKAFGMGIDKPNVRWVVHFGMPQSIESFYQEVGRAGRDGKPAKSIIVLSEIDRTQNEKLLNPTRSEDTRPPPRKWWQGDDIDTVLYFHNKSDVAPGADAEATTKMYHDLCHDNVVPLGADEEARDKSKRALHRLAVLGVIDDYLISGLGKTEKANATITNISAREIERNLVDFVGRSQPGRVAEIEASLPTFSTRREAVKVCAKVLAQVVNETIGLARRRSLYEMWELAGLGTED
ncbi:MAG: RecQ family ATP-dependent DNA helicase, partial [Acidimicrobiia bacterium]|nr:RecQ family ATP-dependent DNA helicase [Acidimicrobiia bacterium]